MADKSGGDATQGNLSTQELNSVAAGGAGVLEGMSGSAFSDASGTQTLTQNQNQSNTANTGNVHADTNINVSTENQSN